MQAYSRFMQAYSRQAVFVGLEKRKRAKTEAEREVKDWEENPRECGVKQAEKGDLSRMRKWPVAQRS